MYAEAMRIKDSLATVGVNVECVGPSTLVDLFERQITALAFLTKQGDFNVVIVADPYSFEAGELVEEKKNGCYSYSFRNAASSSSTSSLLPKGSLGESCYSKLYFVKRKNELFVVSSDFLATRLRSLPGTTE